MAQRLGVVLRKPSTCWDRNPARSRAVWIATVQWRSVGEHVALGERAGLGFADAQPAMPWLSSARRLEQRRQRMRVLVDLDRADVLDHADAGDLVVRLAGQLAVVRDADVHQVADPRLGRALRPAPPAAPKRDAGDRDAVLAAAWIAKLPQPHPTSSTRSPCSSAELGAHELELGLWAASRLGPSREKNAQL